MIFRYGIRQGICKLDPAQALIGAIPRHVTKNFAAITEPVKVGELLRAFDSFNGSYPVACVDAAGISLTLTYNAWRYIVPA
ncbi:hypothetical protein [Bordetella sp. FB-8]|uniref:hypothetical protein n=1 Tax=Bordetella sp. FB-8 TaxID=1159870 RepID=UPI001E5AFAD1|nr:hypothetical protein [Bordetella sp. FB-8]